MLRDNITGVFAYPAAWGDILAGVTAFIVLLVNSIKGTISEKGILAVSLNLSVLPPLNPLCTSSLSLSLVSERTKTKIILPSDLRSQSDCSKLQLMHFPVMIHPF